jgi:hypothetical protein
MEDVERARLQLRATETPHDARRVVGLDDQRRRRRRQGMQPQRDAGDEAEPSLRAADELREVVARDVLHDLPARARDRAVAEDERHAEHEIARRPVAVRERP